MGDIKTDLSGPGIEVVETHGAWVFLGLREVIKVKKPINLGFLDFGSMEKRQAACEAEVRLNARLAPHVYLGVVPITLGNDGRHRVEGDGDVVDWAVKMVRLDDARRADHRLERGLLSVEDIDRLAAHLAEFHESMPTGESISEFGNADAVLANIRQNFAQAEHSVRTHLSDREAEEIEAKQTAFVEERRALFAARVRDGRVRDGHGDLRLEHVYLGDEGPPTIIDCIEFNDRFRYADVCADIAFLSMDLERLGRPDLAERFIATYARASGDYDLYPLVDFYESYRGYVRGKVASILAADARVDFGAREEATKDARRAYLLALLAGREHLIKPCIVAVGGLIASGKSTIAERIGTMVGAPVIEADWTRKQMLGVDPATRVADAPWSGAYAPDVTDRVYAELVRRAACVLSSGRPVVVDASFSHRRHRDAIRRLSDDCGVPFHIVECRADLEVCRTRLRERERNARRGATDGRIDIFESFVAAWESLDEIPAEQHVVVDTTQPIAVTVAYLEERLPSWPSGLNR